VHLAGFAPAFTLSQGDSECSRKVTNKYRFSRYGQAKKMKKTKMKNIKKTVSLRER